MQGQKKKQAKVYQEMIKMILHAAPQCCWLDCMRGDPFELAKDYGSGRDDRALDPMGTNASPLSACLSCHAWDLKEKNANKPLKFFGTQIRFSTAARFSMAIHITQTPRRTPPRWPNPPRWPTPCSTTLTGTPTTTPHRSTPSYNKCRNSANVPGKIDTAYWNTALLDETCPANDVEYDIVWMAWLAPASAAYASTASATHRTWLFSRGAWKPSTARKTATNLPVAGADLRHLRAGYMDQSFGDAPPSPTRRAVRDNCLVLATHADACDMPIVREVWMHLFARTRAPRRARCSRPCLPGCCARSPRPRACAQYAC